MHQGGLHDAVVLAVDVTLVHAVRTTVGGVVPYSWLKVVRERLDVVGEVWFPCAGYLPLAVALAPRLYLPYHSAELRRATCAIAAVIPGELKGVYGNLWSERVFLPTSLHYSLLVDLTMPGCVFVHASFPVCREKSTRFSPRTSGLETCGDQ